jgi:hypothetical protein
MAKSEPMQILRSFREWAIKAEGTLIQWSMKVLGYALVGVALLILVVLGVVVLVVLVPVLVVACIVLGVAIIWSAIVDAVVDTINSVWSSIKEATAKNKTVQSHES